MNEMLDDLIREARAAVAARKEHVPLDELIELEQQAPSARNALRDLRSGPGKVAIIAEISLSTSAALAKDGRADNFTLRAQTFLRGGASALSLISGPFGYESVRTNLRSVRGAVEAPLLRRAHVVSTYQIHEARAGGADMITLSPLLLEPMAMESLIERADSLGMCAVVECHTRLQARNAIAAGARVILVDTFDMSSGQVERSTLEQVIDVIPGEVLVIAASGVSGPHDVFEYARVGADAVLVDEAVLQSPGAADIVADMVAAGSHPALRRDRSSRYRNYSTER